MQERRNVREVVKVVEPEIGMNVRRFQEKVEDSWSRQRTEEWVVIDEEWETPRERMEICAKEV